MLAKTRSLLLPPGALLPGGFLLPSWRYELAAECLSMTGKFRFMANNDIKNSIEKTGQNALFIDYIAYIPL
ncbi:hypothetical protein [Moorella sp. E308F]|uniref:hypothetical protein n=1 Tax=Moorella sp. E308F TaxID=2572682 RepID=UPI001C0EA87B|nr:hypothetical protein [Moorella sp. E308F]